MIPEAPAAAAQGEREQVPAGERGEDPPASFAISIGYPLAYVVLFIAADYVVLLRGMVTTNLTRRVFQGINTAGAIAVGFLTTASFFYDRLSSFYFLFGAALLVAAVAYYIKRPKDRSVEIYFVQGVSRYSGQLCGL